LLAAARMIEAVNRIALAEAPHGRGTVGYIQAAPNSRNVIPGQVKFSVDFRNLAQAGLDRMDAAMREAFALAAVQGQCEVGITQVTKYPPCVFHPDCVDSVRSAARALNLPHMDVVSGAGHDAVYLNGVAPTGMIFVPCKDGISHNEIEDAKPEHLAAGADVLLRAMLAHAR
jgi:N-carbamoyl-L-amino-acid hydrolase